MLVLAKTTIIGCESKIMIQKRVFISFNRLSIHHCVYGNAHRHVKYISKVSLHLANIGTVEHEVLSNGPYCLPVLSYTKVVHISPENSAPFHVQYITILRYLNSVKWYRMKIIDPYIRLGPDFTLVTLESGSLAYTKT